MKRLFLSLPFVALLFATSTTLMPWADAGKPPADVPVTVTIDGLGVNTSPTLRIQSDLAGVYRNSISGESIIQGFGDWELDLINFNSSPQRKILLDLRDAVPGTGPNGGAPINPLGATGYQIVRARFISKCLQNGIYFLNMQTNTPYSCPLALAFQDAGGTQYRLNSNPTNYGGTDWLQVTCEAVGTNLKCKQWLIEPDAIHADEPKNVMTLVKPSSRPKDPELDYGDFYLSFRIHITNP
jgi:hypothetical protein